MLEIDLSYPPAVFHVNNELSVAHAQSRPSPDRWCVPVTCWQRVGHMTVEHQDGAGLSGSDRQSGQKETINRRSFCVWTVRGGE